MKRYDEDFPALLKGIDFITLEESPDVIFGLSRDLELIYFNKAWYDFAKANNGEPAISRNFPVGTSMRQVIAGPVWEFYFEKYRKAMDTLTVWNHDYECSGIDVYRLFRQSALPLKNGQGLVVINSISVEKARDETEETFYNARAEDYLQKTGWLIQCCNCRRTQRANDSPVWDWVPAWVDRIPDHTSHSICPICYDYYWKQPG